jgi:nucleotide-binding universal stress UspA family protein
VNPTLIVCPIEFFSADKAALAQALSLARWHDAELHVLHVRSGRRQAAVTNTRSSDDPFHARLVGFIEALDPAGAKVTPSVLAGDPVTTVVEYARRKSADLIVVPQHGRRASGYWSAGAFATAIGGAVECPTIAVPAGPGVAAEANASFCNILCAIDFSDASIRGLSKALTLAQQSAGSITLLHVLEGFPYETVYSGSRAFRLIDEYRARAQRVNGELHLLVPPGALNWCEVDSETVSGVPHDAIPAIARARKADLIVMGLPRRSRLEQLVTGSTVKRVLRRTLCSVLIVPAPSAMSAGVPHPVVANPDERAANALALEDGASTSWRPRTGVEGCHGGDERAFRTQNATRQPPGTYPESSGRVRRDAGT